ncbi:paraquat-inducible protein A [Sansalvadorimonas sp. 2012CJ34-2]|uniref:Paraquat-inducible protein A n=1 Tax=Parendozoicomonas callyspongiae TaxID=2942213 RepID=A0ABT0PBA5_9GAMM|nr:paraquat-inducible protein A [Sansalvadorimonas sp. 2012CJ34-2]MCL6268600.1 paraquat-inducible protein A [Sansalvadorimonas sp. 2012CJ34-2]
MSVDENSDFNKTANGNHLCPDCDLLLSYDDLLPGNAGKTLRCPRCHHHFRCLSGSLSTCRALTLSGLILYIPANLEPILEIELSGQPSANTVISGVAALWEGGLFLVAVVVCLFALVVPLLRLVILGLVLLPQNVFDRETGCSLMRCHHLLHGWGMMDIFLLGSLIAIIKIQDFAEVMPGPGMLCLGLMMFMEMLASRKLPVEQLWAGFSHE